MLNRFNHYYAPCGFAPPKSLNPTRVRIALRAGSSFKAGTLGNKAKMVVSAIDTPPRMTLMQDQMGY